jgi:hypothetical protein
MRQYNAQTKSVAWVGDRTMPTERPPIVGEVSAEDPNARILGFLDRNRYFCFEVAPHLYSRGWVDLDDPDD